ncbi:SIMPL domain-containing protein [Sphaerisporangium perillae]|uniref:SIMPL domain-containing protein n=1 Tax=Sphaerisporangium perillae TaxID=2935860 RepID=UPI00200FFE1C|nr:SIMPL domain-containing protein [Sphaerisporangium perillae]
MTKLSVVPAAAAFVFAFAGAQAVPALAASGVPAQASPAGVARSAPGRTAVPAELVVVGRGSVQATPDVMRLNVGVEARRPKAGEAFAAVKAAGLKLTDALLAAGVDRTDVRTNDLSLGAEYDKYPNVVGYRATQGAEVLVHDLSRADAVVDAVAAVGEEVRLNGISFEVSRVAALVKKARAAAYRDALAKARQYAQLTGHQVGRMVKLEEEGDASPSRFTMAEKASISPGHASIGVTLRAVFELI